MALPVSITGANVGSGTSVTVDKPSGDWVSGSTLIAQVAAKGSGNTISTPSGWTLVKSASASAVTTAVFSQTLTAVGPSSFEFTYADGGAGSAVIAEYASTTTTGVDTAATPSSNTGTTSTTLTWDSTTTSNANEVVILCAAMDASGVTVSGFTSPFASELLEANSFGAVASFADGTVSAAGATGNQTATLSKNATSWATIALALLPATTGNSASATASIGSIAASGTTSQKQNASAAASIGSLAASGTVTQPANPASATVSIGSLAASGTTTQTNSASGTASVGTVAVSANVSQAGPTTVTTVGTSTFTAPVTATYTFQAIGGGGGGANVGFGGGGGEYAEQTINLTAGEVVTVNIASGGVGGAPNTSSVNPGTAGGSTWAAVGASGTQATAFVLANGGQGGAIQGTAAASGGLGGTGGIGATLFDGGQGGSSTVNPNFLLSESAK